MSINSSYVVQSDCVAASDSQFGPAISGCRESFDFTLLFEQSILSVLPTCLFLLLTPLRLLQLSRTDDKTRKSSMRVFKLGTAAALIGLSLVLMILHASHTGSTTSAALPSAVVGFVASIAIFILSLVEHNKSVKPSLLLSVYLVMTALFDIAQARTLFLLRDSTRVAEVFTAALGVKICLLLLEEQTKRSHLKMPYADLPTESTIGIFNLSLFWWMNETLIKGFRSHICLDDLPKIDAGLGSTRLGDKLQKAWKLSSCQNHSRPLVWAVYKAFQWPLLVMIFPRLCLIGFNYAQPFLITSLMNLLNQPHNAHVQNEGYGLIGAAAIVYIGIAISTGLYKHQLYRYITMFRGAMISVIFQKTLSIQEAAYSESTAVSLMGTDTERICLSIEKVHEVWAQLFEVVIGVALLGRQLGWVCILPLVVVAVSTIGSSRVARVIPRRQKVWTAAIQKRIAITAACVGSMKAIRMMGLEQTMTSILQNQRTEELKLQASFRWLSLWLNGIANAPSAFASALTFIAFDIQAKIKGSDTLNATQAFTSLALISLVVGPAARFLSAVPTLTASLGCFERIQEYLLATSMEDGREFCCDIERHHSHLHMKSNQGLSNIHQQELEKEDVVNIKPPAVSIQNARLRPAKHSTFHHRNVDISIERGAVTIITGPVGSGKTTLAKAILGEVLCEEGSVSIATKKVGYCSQVPWLLNSTIQQNICANQTSREQSDLNWYNTVVHACALEVDIGSFPDGDQQVIGSKALALSGGQRQRVALARCVYARHEIVVLDDIFSSLDGRTEKIILGRLFGKSGLFHDLGTTVILITHSAQHFPLSNHIVVIGPDGTISQRRHPNEFDMEYANLMCIATAEHEPQQEDRLLEPNCFRDPTKPLKQTVPLDMARLSGDLSIYKYYATFIGVQRGLVFIFFQAAHIFSVTFPQVWLTWWTQADGKQITMYTTVYVMFSFLQLLIQGVAIWSILVWIAPWTAAKLHWVLLQTMMGARQSFFSEVDSGVTLNRFSQDLTLVEQALPQAAMMTIGMFFMILGQLSLISLGSSYIAITIPVVFITLYILQFYYLRTSRQIRHLDLEAKSPLYSHFLETLEGVATIRAFGWEGQFEAMNTLKLDASQAPFYILYCIQRWLNLVLDLIVAALAVLVVALAVSIRASTSAARLGLSLNNILGLSMYLSYLINAWTQLETSLGAIARIRNFEAETIQEAQQGEDQAPPREWPQHGQIHLKDLTVCYNATLPVLQDISILVRPGQKLGICGRTGSGKSSLLSSLLRLVEITSGTIYIDGIDISTVPRRLIRERLMAIPQDTFILAGSVRLNACPAPNQTCTDPDQEIISALTKVNLWPLLLSRGGLDCDLRTNPLSQGQQQLFSLARAILQRQDRNGNRKILILDEATSHVDAETDKLMQEVIKEEFKDCTIISVAHRLETIADADVVAVLEGGKLIELGVPEELLKREGSAFSRLH